MHYKNGRKAKAGDRVLHLISGYSGILYNFEATAKSCNGRLSVTNANDPYVTTSECLHRDDIAAATVPDTSIKPS